MTYILFNPLANGGRGIRGLGEVQTFLAAETPEIRDITKLDAASFFAGLTERDRVVLCGGDGTLHRLANDIADIPLRAELLAWRFGTGNDFLRDITGGKKTDCPLIPIGPYLTDLPTAEVDGTRHRFLNGCSCGVDAVVCAMMEENRHKPRRSGYAATALGSFFKNYRPMRARVTVDGETRTYDRLWMAASMNGRFQGGGMNFAPQQDRRGDTLCCMVWHGTSPLGTLLRFPFVIPGWHTRFPMCDIRFGHEITVELEEPTFLQFDGEVLSDVRGYIARK